jgi:hypothetical protein
MKIFGSHVEVYNYDHENVLKETISQSFKEGRKKKNRNEERDTSCLAGFTRLIRTGADGYKKKK